MSHCLCRACFTDGGESYQRFGYEPGVPFHIIDTDEEFWQVHHDLPKL